MKKTTLLLTLLSLLLLFSIPVSADETAKRAIIEPRASAIFNSVASGIHPTYFGGDCTLTYVGSGSVNITLQKKNTSNNSWYTYNNQSSTKYFLHTSVCTYSKNYTLPAGTYRCKTVVKAALDSDPDTVETRTVYSPELTVY